MSDLAEFLLARIAADEEAAKRAAFGYGAGWTSASDDVDDWSAVHADGKRDMVGCEDRDVTRHIARHDPDRVLRRCEADRRIVEQLWLYVAHPDPTSSDPSGTQALWIIKTLALPYADHPDYDPSWRP